MRWTHEPTAPPPSPSIIISTKTVMKTRLTTDTLGHVCASRVFASRGDNNCQSASGGREEEGGMPGGRCSGCGRGEDRASAVRSVHSHMARRPCSTMLDDKEASVSAVGDTHSPLQTPLSAELHTQRPVHADLRDTAALYAYAQAFTRTKHIHRQPHSSSAFCIGDTFHYSKLLPGDVVCTSRGDMHSLQTRYILIMHAQTRGMAF